MLRRTRSASSIRAAAQNHDRDGSRHDAQVFSNRLTLQVLEVEPNLCPHVLEARVVRVVDLRPTGDARFCAMPQRILADLLAKLGHEDRSLWPRPNDVHVAQ